MIDSHCHLAASEFSADLTAVLERAQAAGVERMICIGDTIEESADAVQLAEKHDQLLCTVGVHPHRAISWTSETETTLRSLAASSKKVVAIGEIGLDYHYDHSPRDVQRTVFRRQLTIANELKLPVVIHCREAVDDIRAVVEELTPERLVIHCCSEKWPDVEWFVQQGYFLSFTGIATFPKSEEIRHTIAQCPLDQLMVETDAPFLAPIPHRGKRNEPAYVIEVAKKVAEIKGVSLKEIDEATSRNAVQFFSLR